MFIAALVAMWDVRTTFWSKNDVPAYRHMYITMAPGNRTDLTKTHLLFLIRSGCSPTQAFLVQEFLINPATCVCHTLAGGRTPRRAPPLNNVHLRHSHMLGDPRGPLFHGHQHGRAAKCSLAAWERRCADARPISVKGCVLTSHNNKVACAATSNYTHRLVSPERTVSVLSADA